MKLIFVVPEPGFRIRNPDQNFAPLDPNGETVHASAYWTRMIREGAVRQVEPQQAPKE